MTDIIQLFESGSSDLPRKNRWLELGTASATWLLRPTAIANVVVLVTKMTRQFVTHLSGFSLDGGLETVVESSGHVLQVSHSTGTGSSSSLSLQSPVVRSHLGSWVATRSTGFLLSVERTTAASLTQNVRLSVSLTHRWSTLWYVSNGRKPADRQRRNKNLNLNKTWQNLWQIWTAWTSEILNSLKMKIWTAWKSDQNRIDSRSKADALTSQADCPVCCEMDVFERVLHTTHVDWWLLMKIQKSVFEKSERSRCP